MLQFCASRVGNLVVRQTIKLVAQYCCKTTYLNSSSTAVSIFLNSKLDVPVNQSRYMDSNEQNNMCHLH